MRKRMKLTAGFHSLEMFALLAEAGADEGFCGYVPHRWVEKFGTYQPANRREVLRYPVNFGAIADMRILARMSEQLKVPVAVTLNAPFYRQEQYPVLADGIRELSELGFRRFIIADPCLLWYLQEKQISCDLQLSGEWGTLNSLQLPLLDGCTRIIFHRKVTAADMAAIIRADGGKREYEAFFLNEKCHFHGGFCGSLHCDLLPPLCQEPYELYPVHAGTRISYGSEPPEVAPEGFGASGCGVCALKELERAGITHLKIVGRGGYPELLARDVRTARAILDGKRIGALCSGNCYYQGSGPDKRIIDNS